MSTKKSYMHLLKEAIAEFDTSDTVEVKGPMLDPIIAWSGDGELPTYKDAASILERYYFNENAEEKLNTLDEAEKDYENDRGSKGAQSQKHTEGPGGEEQAGTADAGSIRSMEKEKEKDIAKEAFELSEDEWNDEDVPKKKRFTDEPTNEAVHNFFESLEDAILEGEDNEDEDEEEEEEEEKEVEEGLELENAIIEKLIDEMEDLEEEDKQTSMPKEKKAKDSEEDAQGAGTQQAGTGDDEGEIPSRKDLHQQMVKPKKFTDEHVKEDEEVDDILGQIVNEIELDEGELSGQANADAADAADVNDDMEELDIDQEVAEASAVPGGPSPKRAGGEDWDEGRYYEESQDIFQLFKEAIEEDEDEIDPDDIRV